MNARLPASCTLLCVLALVACDGGAGSVAETGGDPNSMGGGSTAASPTWHADIAPLVAANCTGCHQTDGIAPFSLETYEQAAAFSSIVADAVESGRMPPFLARSTSECEPRFGFKDDLRLTGSEIAQFRAWHDAETPEGDPDSAAPLPEPPELELADADVSAAIPAPVTIEGTADRFICFSLAPDLTPLAPTGLAATLLGDRVLVDGMQVRAGNPKIVHHVLVFTDEQGESAELAGDQGYYDCFGGPNLSAPNLVMAWAPGGVPIRPPASVALALPRNGRLVMQVHYHPTGGPAEVDSSTSIDLSRYDAGIPAYLAMLTLVGNNAQQEVNGMGLQPGVNDRAEPEFRIPADASDHAENMLVAIPEGTPDLRIWTVGTHMHYVGTDMRIALRRQDPGTDPETECLLETPDWNFNWQRGYLYDTPIESAPSAKAGDILDLSCTYNNTLDNPFVRDALLQQDLTEPREVVLGEQTLDEMCLAIFGVAIRILP